MIERALDRFRVLFLLVVTATGIAMGMVSAEAKPFGHDEIYTLVLVGFPSVQTIFASQMAGLEPPPPLNALLTRAVVGVLGPGRVTARLPALAGYVTMSLMAFALVRRRSNTTAALAAAMLPYVAHAFIYAYQARMYGLLVGFFSIAMFAWSEAAAGRRRVLYLPLLAFALTAGFWNHYYSVLILLPLATGEAVRLAHTRKPDWPLWAALAIGITGALPIIALRQQLAQQVVAYWPTHLSDAVYVYRELFGFLLAPRFLLGLAVVIAALLWGVVASRGRTAATRRQRAIAAHEVGALCATLLIPLVGVCVGWLAGAPFYWRYGLPATLAFAVIVPLGVTRVAWPSAIGPTVLCLGLAAGLARAAVQTIGPDGPAFRDPVAERPALTALLNGPDPVVVTDGFYLQVWYYAAPEPRSRAWTVIDLSVPPQPGASDTVARGYGALRQWVSVNVADYHAFVAEHRHFTVYAAGSDQWLLDQLARDHARVELTGREVIDRIYDVTMDR